MTTTNGTYAVPDGLPVLRLRLAAVRNALRVGEENLDRVRAEAEQRIVDSKGGDPKALGVNEADRKRALLLLLEEDRDFTLGREQHQMIRNDTENLAAAIAVAEDDFRERRLAAQERRTDAILRAIEAGIALEISA